MNSDTNELIREAEERAKKISKAREGWTGQVVLFTSPYREKQLALITQVWNVNDSGNPVYVNLVVVSSDTTKDDQYGRQIERPTSVPIISDATTGAGRYFEFLPR